MTLRLTREAEQDADEAIRWYDEKSTTLGDEFLKNVNKCIESIERHPEIYPRVHRQMRRALLERFPYQVPHCECLLISLSKARQRATFRTFLSQPLEQMVQLTHSAPVAAELYRWAASQAAAASATIPS